MVMTIQEIINRANQRWDAGSKIPLPDVELISEERLHTPTDGEPVTDRWNNNFQWAG